MNESRLTAQSLRAGYDSRALVENVAISLKPGEILVLLGPNGGGKTTLLRTLAGRLRPVGGCVLLEGRDLRELSGQERAKGLALLTTERSAGDYLTCRDVAAAGRYPYTGRFGTLREEDRRVIEESLALVHGEDLAELPFDRVSDGQRQRVLLARALCQQPGILLLDEPTSYLDARHRLALLELLERLAREKGISIILSLHEIDLAERIADWVLCVGEGFDPVPKRPEEVFTQAVISRLFQLPEGTYRPGSSVLAPLVRQAASGGKKALLVVSFGSALPRAREDIAAAESAIIDAAEGWEIRHAWSGAPVRKRLQRLGEVILSPEEALEQLEKEGYGTVAIQSTYLLYGAEYDHLEELCRRWAGRFGSLSLGAPVLAGQEELLLLARALLPLGEGQEAVVPVGHGSEHFATLAYPALQTALQALGGAKFLVGVIMGWPDPEAVIAQLRRMNAHRVLLLPLTLTDGRHVRQDIAGKGPQSWRSRLEAAGLQVTCHPEALGQMPVIREINGRHTKKLLGME